MAGGQAKTARGEQTRTAIFDAAMTLFLEQGYEATTMRGIADRAGVALGNSYYYFPSKEHLVQALYERMHHDIVEQAAPLLTRQRDLRKRLLSLMNVAIAVMAPYHGVAGALARTAADPRSPLSPFSEASRPLREEMIELFGDVVSGSSAKIARDLGADLPTLLWTYHMGITLYWVYDLSPGQRRTAKLVEETVDLIVRLITLAQVPLMRPMRRRVTRLVADLLRPDSDGTDTSASDYAAG